MIDFFEVVKSVMRFATELWRYSQLGTMNRHYIVPYGYLI